MRTLINNIRLRHGLAWQRDLPSAAELGFTVGNMALIFGLVLSFGLMSYADASYEASIEAAQQRQQAARDRASLLGCLNGHDTGLTIMRDGVPHRIVCGDAYEISLANIGARHD
jgi:hypothetical protein